MFDTSILEPVSKKREKLVAQVLQELNLKNLVDVETLQKIQDNLAAVTGIAMVTVDYKGVPITKETSFCSFCQERRKIAECKANCFFSDAYGSLKAAMLNSPYIYHCPAGLVDCAVPIIVENNHIGAVIMGQVRCEEAATSELEGIQNLIQNELDLEEYPELKQKFYETKIISLSHLEKTAQLVQCLVCEMVEKQLSLKVQNELQNQVEQLQTQVKMLKSEIIASSEDGAVSNQCISQFMLSSLNMLSTMAVTEGADQTVEGISLYAQMLNKANESYDGFVSIQTEVSFIQKVVEVMKHFFHRKIDLIIHSGAHANEYYIPPFTLYPFVENAIIHGIMPSNRDGKITLTIWYEEEKINLLIEDNGVGFKKDYLVGGSPKQNNKPRLSSLDIESTRYRLEQIYHQEQLIEVYPRAKEEGLTVKVRIPSNR